MLRHLGQALAKTRERLRQGIEQLVFGKPKIDSELLEQLEGVLLGADLGASITQQLLDRLSQQVHRRDGMDAAQLTGFLKAHVMELLKKKQEPLAIGPAVPFVVMMVGVNGVGKTTTIAKLARRFKAGGRSVLLVAGDTFRAAAIEQLEIWGRRVDCPIVKHQAGSDPSAVIFDGLSAAGARGIEVVIVDTAGRMHTRSNLMEELKKMKRVMGKAVSGSPHEVLLVLDATTGQNALSQARQFQDAIGLTGVVLTKLDGTAKGGVAVAIVDELGIPVKWVGIGEGLDDLEEFSPEAFVDGLFGD